MASSLGTAASSLILASSASEVRLSLYLSSSCCSPSLLSFSSSFKSFSPLCSHFSRHQRRSAVNVSSNGGFNSVASPKCVVSDPVQLKSAREDIKQLLKSKFCHPILIRLGWHDAGTYNKNIEEWPQRGGANGSLRFEVELNHAANAGLVNASYSAYQNQIEIRDAGGPKIPMNYGRVDVSGPNECPEEGRQPDAGPPPPADHLCFLSNGIK
ncbi:L-ascorbate peroxidase S [Hibiscus syriacus]|uniref:L-ascorbate peroxidase S n=1 Tax=Hibiscus syriacus TaxID=106335 RepID=A0A6A2ZUK4_HIBSY|nr:L-ascorbate peroxidase S [Hibiscus syriacus]